MKYQAIKLMFQEKVAILTMNRPEKMNSLSDLMQDEIRNALDSIASDGKTRALVMTGAGNAFSAGADLSHSIFSEKTEAGRLSKMTSLHSIPLKLQSLPFPTIAAVNGVAVGAAANFALACDIILASPQARFGQVFVNVGIHVDAGGTYFLPRAVGVPRAMELLLTGRIIGAEEAEKIGMITRIVPAEELEKVSLDMAQAFARGPYNALAMIKASVYQNLGKDLEAALQREAECQAKLVGSPDNQEGIKAFREKRKPNFPGR